MRVPSALEALTVTPPTEVVYPRRVGRTNRQCGTLPNGTAVSTPSKMQWKCSYLA